MTLDQDERRQLFETGQLLLGLYLRAKQQQENRTAEMVITALDAIKSIVEGAAMVD